MAWITLTTEHIRRSLTGAELSAVQTTALGEGQSDPLPATLDGVVKEIRGYVSACERNTLGDGETIPDELLDAAIAIARWRALTRLPVARLATEQRREENDAAVRLLREVAACRFRIAQPATASAENLASGGAQVISSRTRITKGSDLSGL